MIKRSTWWRLGAVGAAPLSLLAGYLWHASYEPEYVAYARITVPQQTVEALIGARNSLAPSIEEVLLSPENVTKAADLLRARGVILSTVSPLDSDVEELIRRVDAAHETTIGQTEVRISYQTPDSEQGIPILVALLDACLGSLNPTVPEGEKSLAASREAELRDLAAALVQRQQELTGLEQRVTRMNAEQLDPSLLEDRIHSLEAALEQARTHRIVAEDRLAEIHQQLGAGVAAEQIADELPAGPTTDVTRASVASSRALDELREHQEMLARASTIYGKNHPRLIRIRGEVERLKQQAGVVPAVAEMASVPASKLLVQAQESALNRATDAEQEAQTQLDRTKADREARRELEDQLASAHEELTALHQQRDALQRQIEQDRRAAGALQATISEPPALAPEAIVPPLSTHLTWGALVGLCLSLGCWKKGRNRPARKMSAILLPGPTLPVTTDRVHPRPASISWETPDAPPGELPPATAGVALVEPVSTPPSSEGPAVRLPPKELPVEIPVAEKPTSDEPALATAESPSLAPPARERFRSEEEEKLTRLKRLAAQAS